MPLKLFKRTYQKKLIPTPALFWQWQKDPFEHTHDKEQASLTDVYFATERQPSKNARFYNSKRDHVLHVGKASVQLGSEKTTWAQIVQESLKQKRKADPMLAVKSVQVFGSLWTASAEDSHKEKEQEESAAFAQDINQKLARSHSKDIYIFVQLFLTTLYRSTVNSRHNLERMVIRGRFKS